MRSSILDKIIQTKKDEVEKARSKVSIEQLSQQLGTLSEPLNFRAAVVEADFPAIIAEIKRASPSKGVFAEHLDPVTTALAFEGAGAVALSVLTDEVYFKGHLSFLGQIKEAKVRIPILRKDFIVDEYQVLESRAKGADCILLIVSALNEREIQNLLLKAISLKLSVLIEVHDKTEVDTVSSILKLHTKCKERVLVGINNRNLNTFETSLDVSKELCPYIKDVLGSDVPVISESGIFTGEDLKVLQGYGANGFLIGESLVRSGSAGENLENIIKSARS